MSAARVFPEDVWEELAFEDLILNQIRISTSIKI